jgi:phenylalanyl-tRNA synthetase beta chain
MQKVLRASGMRPINNIVDITNYVMLETGQPLHAFDYDKLEGQQIVVRAAKEGEKIVTLDGLERTLDSDMILITDAKKPVAIAGVMGGGNSEVDKDTINILFESAHFHYAHVRNTSRKLGLRSEASSRFERGVAPEVSMYAVNRAVDLVEQMEAGIVVPGAVDNYPVKQEKHIVELNPARVNAILGTDISAEDMLSYFERLGFGVVVEPGSDIASIDIPYYRTDITRHVDLIEEVARIYGFDKIPTTLPVSATNSKRQKPEITLNGMVKDVLCGLGLSEIVTYAFIHPEEYTKLQHEEWLDSSVRILNPLSEAQSVMRVSLLPGILNIAKNNIRKNQKNLKLYEVGKVFEHITVNELPIEKRRVSCLVTGEKIRNWYGYSDDVDFFYLKGIAESLLDKLNISDVSFVPVKDDGAFHPGRCASIMVEGKVAGIIGEIHPQALENFGINQRVYAMELTLDGFVEAVSNVKSYSELPKYPSSNRDIAFTIKEDVLDSKIMEVIADASSDKLVDYRLFDVYNGEQIEDGYKSLAYNLTYQDSEKTLTDEEVAGIHQSIQNSLEEKLGAKLR